MGRSIGLLLLVVLTAVVHVGADEGGSLTLEECGRLAVKPVDDIPCVNLFDCILAALSSCTTDEIDTAQKTYQNLDESERTRIDKAKFCSATSKQQGCRERYVDNRTDDNCEKAMDHYSVAAYRSQFAIGGRKFLHKWLKPGHKCVDGELQDCESDGSSKSSDADPDSCCSGVINKYMPYNQLRCGKIPNDYYCSNDSQCESGNCSPVASNGDRGPDIRTCAPTGKQGWQGACNVDSECASDYLKCHFGRCDCTVMAYGGARNVTCCSDKSKIGNPQSYCRYPRVGDYCNSDIQCANQTTVSFSCDGSNCVAVAN